MKPYILLAAVLFCFHGVKAQQRKIMADKIVGVVGDKIILHSEIHDLIADEQRRGKVVPENSECAFLQQILISRALQLQAEKDSLYVSEEEVESALDGRIRQLLAQYSFTEIHDISGRTLYQLKEEFRTAIREQMLAQAMRNKLTRNVRITPSDVKAFYDKIPADELPLLEAEFEIGEIVSYPKTTRDYELLSIEELKRYKSLAESGTRKFEILADLYSDDKKTQQQGGLLSVNRLEQGWDPTFKAAVFRLKEGQVSPVIRSKSGFHIISLVSRNGDDAVVRHILSIPEITDEEINHSALLLDSVRQELINASISFGAAVAKYSDDETTKFSSGGLRITATSLLDKSLFPVLAELKVGGYSKPLVFKDENGKHAVKIVYLRSAKEAHRLNLKDDYNNIATEARREKENQLVEQWFNTRIPELYTMIDESYRGCADIRPWIK